MILDRCSSCASDTNLACTDLAALCCTRQPSIDPDRVCLQSVPASECPADANIANCYSDIPIGGLCEGDGECGTLNSLDNCGVGGYDVYRRVSCAGDGGMVCPRPDRRPTSWPTYEGTSTTPWPTYEGTSTTSPSLSPSASPSDAPSKSNQPSSQVSVQRDCSNDS